MADLKTLVLWLWVFVLLQSQCLCLAIHLQCDAPFNVLWVNLKRTLEVSGTLIPSFEAPKQGNEGIKLREKRDICI